MARCIITISNLSNSLISSNEWTSKNTCNFSTIHWDSTMKEVMSWFVYSRDANLSAESYRRWISFENVPSLFSQNGVTSFEHCEGFQLWDFTSCHDKAQSWKSICFHVQLFQVIIKTLAREPKLNRCRPREVTFSIKLLSNCGSLNKRGCRS